MKKISIFLLAMASLFTVSCDKDFEEINKDPNRPVNVPAHLLLGNIVRNNQNNIYNTFVGGDMGACWAQQWSKVQYNDEERYIPRRGVIDGLWTGLYTTVLMETKEMERLAVLEGNTNLQGAALILRANAFQILTDVYGPIPFTQALDPEVRQPAYDSEEVVYSGIIAMLTQADAVLASGTGDIPASSDLVFGGDASKWRKLANALKLKALMRISKAPGVNNAAEIQALVSAGNLMSSNSDSAQLTYLAAQPDANPIYETVVFGSRAEWKVSSVLVSKMNSLTDPRLPVFAQKNNANAYVGNIPGQENSGNYNGFSSLGTKILEATFPGVIMSYAQQQLLLAEAANEGYVAGGIATAKTYYNSGIQASCLFFGVAPGATATYIANPALDFATQADARQKIAEQAWLSLFGQGVEAWSEWRRTDYPVLTPVVSAALPSIPTRYYYPTNEASLNSANYNAASSNIGGDELTSSLWWTN